MKVFLAIERTDPKPAAHGDSQAQFLDRVAGPYWDQVRDLVEDWFSRLPRTPRRTSRVGCAARTTGIQEAFFALYLHECLLRMGYDVTCHPEVNRTSRRPDFLAEKDGIALYVEARSASPSDVSVGASARVNTVYESLDKVDSPNFFLWIDVVKHGDGPLRARPLRPRLEEWLRDLDPDAYEDHGNGRRDFPGLPLEANGWRIQFHAIPKSPEARGREGVRPLGIFGGGRAFWVHDEGLRGALSDKGSAYGTLGAPYVVAVASSSMSTDDYDVINSSVSELPWTRTLASSNALVPLTRMAPSYASTTERDIRGQPAKVAGTSKVALMTLPTFARRASSAQLGVLAGRSGGRAEARHSVARGLGAVGPRDGLGLTLRQEPGVGLAVVADGDRAVSEMNDLDNMGMAGDGSGMVVIPAVRRRRRARGHQGRPLLRGIPVHGLSRVAARLRILFNTVRAPGHPAGRTRRTTTSPYRNNGQVRRCGVRR